MDQLVALVAGNLVVALLLALAVEILSWGWRRPALLHALWLIVLLKLLAPAFVAVPVSWNDPPTQTIAVAHHGPITPTVPMNDVPASPVESAAAAIDPTPLISYVALAGSLMWLAIFGVRVFRFRRMLRHACPADPRIQNRAFDLAQLLRLRHRPSIWVTDATVPPFLWGMPWQTSIVLPRGLWHKLDVEQQDALLLHELSHASRGDPWVRLLEVAVLSLHWWNPLAWWASRRLREAEELCCDATVVRLMPGAARSYALALMDTIDYLADARPNLPAVASGISQFSTMKRRLTMILQCSNSGMLSRSAGVFAMIVALFVLPLHPVQSMGADTPEIKQGDTDKPEELLDLLKTRKALLVQVMAAMGANEKLQVELAEVESQMSEVLRDRKDGDTQRQIDRQVEEIAVLRRLLHEKEESLRKLKGKESKKIDRGTLDNVRSQLERAKADLERARAELEKRSDAQKKLDRRQELERQLEQARKHAAELQREIEKMKGQPNKKSEKKPESKKIDRDGMNKDLEEMKRALEDLKKRLGRP